MQQDYCITVAMVRVNEPGAESSVISCRYLNICNFRLQWRNGVAYLNFRISRKGPAIGMQCGVCQENGSSRTQEYVDYARGDEQP
jgi:hypothetical protein